MKSVDIYNLSDVIIQQEESQGILGLILLLKSIGNLLHVH